MVHLRLTFLWILLLGKVLDLSFRAGRKALGSGFSLAKQITVEEIFEALVVWQVRASLESLQTGAIHCNISFPGPVGNAMQPHTEDEARM